MKCSFWAIAFFGIFLVIRRGTCGAPEKTGDDTAVACTPSTELELKTFRQFKRGLDACTIFTIKIWIYIHRNPKKVLRSFARLPEYNREFTGDTGDKVMKLLRKQKDKNFLKQLTSLAVPRLNDIIKSMEKVCDEDKGMHIKVTFQSAIILLDIIGPDEHLLDATIQLLMKILDNPCTCLNQEQMEFIQEEVTRIICQYEKANRIKKMTHDKFIEFTGIIKSLGSTQFEDGCRASEFLTTKLVMGVVATVDHFPESATSPEKWEWVRAQHVLDEKSIIIEAANPKYHPVVCEVRTQWNKHMLELMTKLEVDGYTHQHPKKMELDEFKQELSAIDDNTEKDTLLELGDTYAFIAFDFDISDDVHNQVYNTLAELMKLDAEQWTEHVQYWQILIEYKLRVLLSPKYAGPHMNFNQQLIEQTMKCLIIMTRVNIDKSDLHTMAALIEYTFDSRLHDWRSKWLHVQVHVHPQAQPTMGEHLNIIAEHFVNLNHKKTWSNEESNYVAAKAGSMERRLHSCELQCKNTVGDIVKFGFRVITAREWNTKSESKLQKDVEKSVGSLVELMLRNNKPTSQLFPKTIIESAVHKYKTYSAVIRTVMDTLKMKSKMKIN